jgi:predicted transcriptional regulator
MDTVRSIEQAVENLPPDELAEFRRWFAEFDAANWDARIEADACRRQARIAGRRELGRVPRRRLGPHRASRGSAAMKRSNRELAWRTSQVEALKTAVQDADAGEFASDAEVLAVFERYARCRARTDAAQLKLPPAERNVPPPR